MHCDIRTETFGKFLGFLSPDCQFLSLRDGFVNPTPVRVHVISASRPNRINLCFRKLRLACEQALLFGRVKRVSREHASFACPNRRACSQAKLRSKQPTHHISGTSQAVLPRRTRVFKSFCGTKLRLPRPMRTCQGVCFI